MAESIDYTKKIDGIVQELPEFVYSFIYDYLGPRPNNTKYQYIRDIREFMEFMINFLPDCSEKSTKEITCEDMDAIRSADIQKYISTITGSGKNMLQPTTVKRRRASVSSLFSFLVANRYVKTNPVFATKFTVPNKDSVIYLTDEEQAIFLRAIRSGEQLSETEQKIHNIYEARDSALFLLFLDTGLRVSEVVSTNISDYNLKDKSVKVVRKGGDEQTIWFSEPTKERLDYYFSSQRAKYMLRDKDMPAFTTSTGKRLGVRAIETLVKKYAAGCLPEKVAKISPHKLRSSFAMSFYKDSKNNILLLQEKMNHKSIATTTIYAKASNKEMQESQDIFKDKWSKL